MLKNSNTLTKKVTAIKFKTARTITGFRIHGYMSLIIVYASVIGKRKPSEIQLIFVAF
jgi:hypothetical protein